MTFPRILAAFAAASLGLVPVGAGAQTIGAGGGGIIPGAVTDCSSVASLCLNLQNPVGTTVFSVDKTGIITIPSSVYLLASGGNGKFGFINNNIPALEGPVGDIRLNTDGSLGLGTNAKLYGEAANTLAQRNGVNAQTFNVYSSFTDTSNYQRLFVGTHGGSVGLLGEAAGTGGAFSVDIGTGTGNNGQVGLDVNNVRQWAVDVTGNFSGQTAAGYVLTKPTTVSGLQTCGSSQKGARSFVTDANATTFLSAVAGGGANNVPVVCDGTSWKIG